MALAKSKALRQALRADRANRIGKSRGFTLIELMVAMVVSGIVLMGIFAFSSIQQGTAVIHRRHVRIQQALEGSMYSIGRDVRMAGLGFTRLCTELRVWDAAGNRLINPGALDGNLNATPVDVRTEEPYWVLRDGIQAHWRSDGANSIEGTQFTSASLDSAADSFDVILGERNFTTSMGMFELAEDPKGLTSAGNETLVLRTNGTMLDSGNVNHLQQVRQLMPPGSFVLIARNPTADPDNPGQEFRPNSRGQCALLQVTADVIGNGGDVWDVPIGNNSGFNGNLDELFGNEPDDCTDGDCDDWQAADRAEGALVVPLGRLRWSRYEVDYRNAQKPYLVRSDIIGWIAGDPTFGPPQETYPDCTAQACNLAALHLPNDNGVPVPKVAIGPMIEDMQVAVACDGFTDASAVARQLPNTPDAGFAEKGDEPNQVPNKFPDEWTDDKTQDEWLGNAAAEKWGPDCVYYGTGEERRDDWPATGPASETGFGPGFRMSPQAIRITLLGKSETTAGNNADDAANEFFNKLFPLEDRPKMDPVAGQREYLTLTERFAPRNLRWRDPGLI